LTGEDEGGGAEIIGILKILLFPPPLYPLPPGEGKAVVGQHRWGEFEDSFAIPFFLVRSSTFKYKF
jgi:hypothetical protein